MQSRFCKLFRAICTAALLANLAACGGGTKVSIGNPPNTSVGTGAINVTVSGAPSGQIGVVRVHGPNNFSQSLDGTGILTGLVPGTYRILAEPLVIGNTVYRSTVTPASFTLIFGTTAQVEVRFTAASANFLTTRLFVSGLEFPTFLTSPPSDLRQFITERPGRIRIVRDGNVLSTPFLDISARVFTGGEGGLLSMAFDPQYNSTGVFYIYYTDSARDIVVERHTVSSNPDRANGTGYTEVIRIAHPNFTNHFGGTVTFGSDGHLYIATGDGGGAGDPAGNAQNTNSLLGKILRLDVLQSTATVPYRIPPDNPFVNRPGFRPEIWALGLRNPWRFTFEEELMIVADVGQDRAEEINISHLGAGLNYGWDIMEGTQCAGTSGCATAGLELPAVEYTHADTGGCSVTGGFVYFGATFPELHGHYFFSDFCAGFLKSFSVYGTMPTAQTTWNVPGLADIVSFGRDGSGELYVISSSGNIHKLVRAP